MFVVLRGPQSLIGGYFYIVANVRCVVWAALGVSYGPQVLYGRCFPLAINIHIVQCYQSHCPVLPQVLLYWPGLPDSVLSPLAPGRGPSPS